MQTVIARSAIGALFLFSFIQGCATGQSSVDGEPELAAALSAESGYVAHGGGIVMTQADECVRTKFWSQDRVLVECDAIADKTPEIPVPAEIKKGSSVVSYNARALFEFDSASLTGTGQAELDRLTKILNEQTVVESIEIVGHADSIGTDEYNQDLSERRADAVRTYLQRSLETVGVTSKGMGESAPIASNDTEAGRSVNRRVDVVVSALVEDQ